MDNENKELEVKTDIDGASANVEIKAKQESKNTEIKAPEVPAKKGGKPKPKKATAPKSVASTAKQEETIKVSDAAAEKVGKRILESNSDMQEVYVAADGRAFYHKNDADNHARTLKNKVVTTVIR